MRFGKLFSLVGVLLFALSFSRTEAQVPVYQNVVFVSSAPSGACSPGSPAQIVITTGIFYTCQNSVWGLSSSAGPGNAAVPYAIAQTGIPVGVAPNGTIATNGTVTLGTALPVTFPNIWLYFPASAVSGGAAGLYYATCSSTTVCAVTTTFVDASTTAFTPYIPASTAAATGSNSAYTQTTGSQIALINVTIPANVMGANGTLRRTVTWGYINNADTKTVQLKFGASAVSFALTTSAVAFRSQWEIHNAGDATKQLYYAGLGAPLGITAAVPAQGTNDTTGATTILTQCQLATATDYCLVVNELDEIFPHS